MFKHTMLQPLTLALPEGLEELYWSSPDTINRILAVDAFGLSLGAMLHILLAGLKTRWHTVVRVLSAAGGTMQLAQVRRRWRRRWRWRWRSSSSSAGARQDPWHERARVLAETRC
jgi:hypothetical protein